MSAPIILASTSTTRLDMLRRAGLEVETVSPRVDEDEVKAALRAADVTPRDQADHLAEMKALRVSSRAPGILVIGADQVLGLGEEVFDKPVDVVAARIQLLRLRGQRHQLFSAAVIALDGAPIWRHVGAPRLTMRDFSEPFLDDYLSRVGEDVLHTCGGYRIEEEGAQLFSRIEGDWFSILGLPLLEIMAFLRVRGVLPE